jgi:hypothetical protein
VKLDYEYIVLGLGGFGSAAAYWLARREGGEVLGIEQFELGHVRGESQDHSRIIRLSYHATHYVEMAKHAYLAWHEVECDAGEQLVLRTGGLDLGARVSAIPLSTYSDSMDAAAVRYERLDAGEIMRRWPQWRLTDEVHGLFQEQAGIAMAARGNAAHIRMAREYGATLLERSPVDSIRHRDGEVEVVAGGRLSRAPAGRDRRGLVQSCPPGSRDRAPAPRHQGAGELFRCAQPGGVRARAVSGLDLDGRSLLLWFSGLRRARSEGGPGRGRAGGHRRDPHLRHR